MKRIKKPEAKKLFNQGRVIYLVPAKANLHSKWIQPMGMSKRQYGNFDKQVNAFEYYNCHAPFGKYAWYYIK